MNNQKQFGVWMDTQHAVVAGRDHDGTGEPAILAHITGETIAPNSGNKNENNQKKMLQAKFFKEITAYLLNATHLHVTGTGKVQEQFIHYLAETPRFKNLQATESTANRMSDERLLEFFAEKFN